MRCSGHPFQVLSPVEEATIHRNALRIVDEVGLQVECDPLLERMAALGGRVDRGTRRVTFSPDASEAFIASAKPAEQYRQPPQVTADASIYYGHYLDPHTGEFLPMTTERAALYFQVARALPNVQPSGILGCPFEGIPPELEPLYERYWCWRLGVRPHGSLHRVELGPAILEMCQSHAAHTGLPLTEVFTGTVYLVPPLRLGYQEAEQVVWFAERGLRVNIGGGMASGGATAPITLAGMVTLTIAEHILLGLLHRALYGDRTWNIWMAATMLDPRTSFRPYGRPDAALANLMGAQMARRYGAAFAGHGGLSDAMRPSPQAASQKIISALPTLLASGRASISAGLLGVDEIFSPVQMVLDSETAGALGQFAREFEVSDEAIAADLVAAVGPGGSFMAEPHTAAWLRRELWEPALWERQSFVTWQQRDGKTDVERAQERVLAILSAPGDQSAIGDAEDQELTRVLSVARRLERNH